MNTAAAREQFTALVGVLRQEQAALDWLAFKVSEAELLTESQESRFLTMIVDEVDEIADELGTIEVARAMIVAELCDALGRPGEDEISLSDLIVAIERALGTKAVIDRQPEQPGDVKRTFADITLARRELGYEPGTDLAGGLAHFVEWYRTSKGTTDSRG